MFGSTPRVTFELLFLYFEISGVLGLVGPVAPHKFEPASVGGSRRASPKLMWSPRAPQEGARPTHVHHWGKGAVQIGGSLVGVWSAWGYGIAFFRAPNFQNSEPQIWQKLADSAEFQGFSCKFRPLKSAFRNREKWQFHMLPNWIHTPLSAGRGWSFRSGLWFSKGFAAQHGQAILGEFEGLRRASPQSHKCSFSFPPSEQITLKNTVWEAPLGKSLQGGPGTEPEPETGTVGTVFPRTERGTGTAGTVLSVKLYWKKKKKPP